MTPTNDSLEGIILRMTGVADFHASEVEADCSNFEEDSTQLQGPGSMLRVDLESLKTGIVFLVVNSTILCLGVVGGILLIDQGLAATLGNAGDAAAPKKEPSPVHPPPDTLKASEAEAEPATAWPSAEASPTVENKSFFNASKNFVKSTEIKVNLTIDYASERATIHADIPVHKVMAALKKFFFGPRSRASAQKELD